MRWLRFFLEFLYPGPEERKNIWLKMKPVLVATRTDFRKESSLHPG
jgi:hypothetical protein